MADTIRTVVAVAALVLSILTISYTVGRDNLSRKSATINYWTSTYESRFASRQILPFEFELDNVRRFEEDVMNLDADLQQARLTSDEVLYKMAGSRKVKPCIHDLGNRVKRRTEFYRYLSQVETLGAGLSAKAFDLETIRALDGDRLEQVWVAYGTLIRKWRETRDSDNLYAGVESLAIALNGDVVPAP